MITPPPGTRRVTITLRKWPFGLYFGVRPTIVIDGRGQPTQWGVGTWQLPDDRDTTVSVFMFQAGREFGRADHLLSAADDAALEYSAPAMALYSGEIGAPGTTRHSGAGVALLTIIGIPVVVAAVIVLAIVTR